MWFLIYILCLITYLSIYAGFLGDSVVKNPPVNAGDAGNMGSIPGLGNLLEEEMATHSTILTWEIPWTEDPGRLEPMWLQRVRHNWATEQKHTSIYIFMGDIYVFQYLQTYLRSWPLTKWDSLSIPQSHNAIFTDFTNLDRHRNKYW